ncbi:hypothetical protein BU072_08555 [Mammaliicoccus vitulinus]|uniref:Uncharacterized protein n=1 Tax=Mammaliicoccus vitulinus TaxID=71237 RepID=A0A2T4PSS9_9STAP|nr:hypothetical protein [Mammaliicoccus vitulinus]PTI29396.1 hypothetical protein BU072_08555 [Mammaliicoccus vitulinus]
MLNICIYICNYIPLFLLIFLNEIRKAEDNQKSVCSVILEFKLYWIILLLVSVLSILVLLYRWLKNAQSSDEIPGELKIINTDILNYFVTYLIPLLSLDLANIYSISINFIIFIIIGVFHTKSDMLHYNLLLVLMGYNIYSNDKNKIFISKCDLVEDCNDKQVYQIASSRYFLVK